MLKIILMGTPDYAVTILKALHKLETCKIVGVFTQPDKPVGRKKVLTAPPVKEYALLKKLAVFQPEILSSSSAFDEISALKPDFIIVASYGQILKENILNIAPCINLHASILPSYRGATPIQESLKNGDKLSGITAMYMDKGVDTGDILGYSFLNIKKLSAPATFRKMAKKAAKLTVNILENWNTINPQKQNKAQATITKKITKSLSQANLNSAKEIFNLYRAYTPWPGVATFGGLKLVEIDGFIKQNSTMCTGAITDIGTQTITIACKKGQIVIRTLQESSKKPLNATVYIRGKRLGMGDILV